MHADENVAGPATMAGARADGRPGRTRPIGDAGLADLGHHGDADLVPGLTDLAVNVRSSGTPAWLADRIRSADLAAYPDQRAALDAVAARHGRQTDEVLLTAGAAEAFVLLARVLRPRHAVVVHPQFTEPEAALRAAGHQVNRVILAFPFTLDPALVPAEADLVFVGNPTNPTSVAHPRETLLRLVRPGRTVVVDEAFADCLPGEPQSLACIPDLAGLVVIRSLTKTWALAGLRVGYVLAAPPLVRLLATAQPPWPVSNPALTACVATATDAAAREVAEWSRGLADARDHLHDRLAAIDGIRVGPGASASFVLLDTGVADIRTRLHRHGFAVRRGETFPGLGPGWIRVAVRDPETSDRFAAALRAAIAEGPGRQAGVGTGRPDATAGGSPATPAAGASTSTPATDAGAPAEATDVSPPAPLTGPSRVTAVADTSAPTAVADAGAATSATVPGRPVAIGASPKRREPASGTPMGRRVLVLGGSRSGKSRRAEELLAGQEQVTYVATARPDPDDAEWAERIERHRRRRPAGWATAETTDPAALIRQADDGALLIDSVTTWVAQVMDECGCWLPTQPAEADRRLADAVNALVGAWADASVTVVAVSDEVGGGVVPATASGRRFRDELGQLNQRLAAAADEVWLVTAGIPWRLR